MLRQAAAVEGLDQVGKRTLTNRLVEDLVADGYTIGKCDLPQYWINDTVRLMNRVHPGIMQVLGQVQEAGGGYRVAEIRSAHYALDRAFTLAMCSHLEQTYPDITFVSNRLVLSNAVTAGFAQFGNYLTADQIPQFISEVIIPNERDFLDAYNLLNILCVNGESGHIGRIEDMLDIYEMPGVQEMSARVYELIFRDQAQFGVNMTKVVTRTGDQWRPIEESTAEVRMQMGVVQPIGESGKIISVSPHTYIDTFVPKHLITRNHHALWEAAQGLAGVWEQLSVQVDRTTLDKFEMGMMAPALKRMLMLVNPAELDVDPRACHTIAHLFDRYPELVDIVRAGSGEFGDGMVRFMEGLANQSREA